MAVRSTALRHPEERFLTCHPEERSDEGSGFPSSRLARVTQLAAVLLLFAVTLPAQQPVPANDSASLFKGLDLEGAGKYKEAVPYFRAALNSASSVSALLGLERVYNELGWADSLLAPVDTLIRQHPTEIVFRSVQLRTLQTLGREQELRRAFERWTKEAPGDATPYREFAAILLQRNQTASADSVIRRARQALGSAGDLQLQIAQLKAAMGQWEESAQAWRLALASSPYLEQSAVYALAPMPAASRPVVRGIFLAAPPVVGARRALADLAMNWGAPAEGWNALKELPADSESVAAWVDFAQRAESEERWTLAREAFVAALGWHRTRELAVRAATAALNAGDPAAVPVLAPFSEAGSDSTQIARVYVPLYARAYAMVGRPADAERLVQQFDRWLVPGAKNQLTRTVAWGWVRSGNTARARDVLRAAGAEGDSSDAAGWLALYEGNLKSARVLLRSGNETSPELALALGLIARLHVDSAPGLGRGFLALARADSMGAAAAFEESAERLPDASSLLLSTAARIRFALKDETQAMALWKRIVEQQSATPEAPEAELEWARALRRRGDVPAALAHLEHLILTYPQSALVPEARRELDLARSSIPGTTQ